MFSSSFAITPAHSLQNFADDGNFNNMPTTDLIDYLESRSFRSYLSPKERTKARIEVVDVIMKRENALSNLSPKDLLSFLSAFIDVRADLRNKKIGELVKYVKELVLLSENKANLEEKLKDSYQKSCILIINEIIRHKDKLSNLPSEDFIYFSTALIEAQEKFVNKKLESEEITKLIDRIVEFLEFFKTKSELEEAEIAVCKKACAVLIGKIAKYKEEISKLSLENLLSLSSALVEIYIGGYLAKEDFLKALPDIFISLVGDINGDKLDSLSLEQMSIPASTLIESKEVYRDASAVLNHFEDAKIEKIKKPLQNIKNITKQLDLCRVYQAVSSAILAIVYYRFFDLYKVENKSTENLSDRLAGIFFSNMMSRQSEILELLAKIESSIKKVERSQIKITKEDTKEIMLLEGLMEHQLKALQSAQEKVKNIALSLEEVVKILISDVNLLKKTEQKKPYFSIIFKVAETIGFSQVIANKMKWTAEDTKTIGWFYERSGDAAKVSSLRVDHLSLDVEKYI